MARYFEKITVDEFKDKLCDAAKAFYIRTEGKIYDLWFQNGEWFWRMNWKYVTKKVEKDLSKIEFSDENYICGDDRYPEELKDLIGIHQLNNGLTFFGMLAGGDSELPLFFILYHDGKQFRGYIPEVSNCFNASTKTAFGNDEDEDTKYLIKLGIAKDEEEAEDVLTSEDWNWNADALIKDITTRIIEK